MKSESRDARRWAAYERLAADASASPSERGQAEEQLTTLRARYPGGRPAAPRRDAWTREAGSAWAGRRGAWTWATREPDPPSPAEQAAAEAAAEEEKLRRVRTVEWQRQAVERVPRWEASAVLRDLHERRDVWCAEEQGLFKLERLRLTGSSRAIDL